MQINDVQDVLTLSAVIDEAAEDKTTLIAALMNWRAMGVAGAVAAAIGAERTQANVAAQREPEVEPEFDTMPDPEPTKPVEPPVKSKPPVKKAAAKKAPAKPVDDDEDF